MSLDTAESSRSLTLTAPAQPRPRLAARPRLDLYEGPDEFLLIADVPGVNVSTLDLQLERGVLKLRGEIQGTCEDRAVSVEQRATEWSRAVTVPEGVDAEGLRAELGDGVLTIHLKKSDQARPRRVPIAVR